MEKIFENIKIKKILFIGITLAIVLVSSLPAFRSGVYNGHDLWFHFGRIEAIAEELSNGQFPVRYESSGWYGNGYISSIMYGNIFLYLPALLHLCGLATYKCYNIYVIAINLIGVLIALYSFTKLFKDYGVGILCTMAYMLSGYYISNVYKRAAVGEFTAMIFLPLVVYGLYRIYYEEDYNGLVKKVLPFVLGVSGLIQSHILSTVMVAIAVLVFVVLNWKATIVNIKYLIFALMLTIGLNAFFIVPFIESYLSYDFNASVGTAGKNIRGLGLYLDQILGLFPEGSGDMLEWTSQGEEYTRLGIVHVAFLLLSVIVIILNKRDNNKVILTVFIIGVLSAWMSSVYFPWGIFSGDNPVSNIFRAVQYPSRYLLIQTICWTVCGGYGLKFLINNNTKISQFTKLCVSLVVISVLVLIQTGIFMYTLSCRTETVQTIDRATFSDGLYLQTGTDTTKLSSEIQVLTGNSKINDLGFTKGKRTFEINNGSQETTLLLPILDYKYIQAFDTKGESMVLTSDENHQYFVVLEPGFNDTLKIGFVEPLHWRFAECISLIVLVFSCIKGCRKKEK